MIPALLRILAVFLERVLIWAKPAILPYAMEKAMNPIVSTVVSLCIPYLVSDLTAATGAFDWAGAKTKAHAAVAGAVHSAMADKVIDDAIDGVLNACQKVLADKPNLQAALTALAKQDKAAAIKALEALVAPVLPADLAALLPAA